jgi:nucleoside-diphosphate-sugar epimerase
MTNKKLLILGSTGRTGKYLLKEALARGFEINILVRDIQKVKIRSEKLRIFEGTPFNKEDLAEALQGCTHVLSALNISRNSDFPWSGLRTPKNFLEKTIQNLIDLSKINPLQSVIIISAWGVSETRNDIPFWFRWMINFTNVKYGYLGHEDQERLLKNSDLDWTIVRPVILTNNKIIKIVLVSLHNYPKPNFLISRMNVANFMLDIFEKSLYVKQTPTIST